MNGITRRDALRASGLALGPLVGAVLPNVSFGESGISGVPQFNSGLGGRKTLSPDIQAYVVRDVPRLLAKARKGSLDASDYQSLSSSFHLFARHMQSVDTEPLRARAVASSSTSSAVDLSQLNEAHNLYSERIQHDPGLSRDEFRKSLTFQSHQLEQGRQALAANTIPWHLHTMADALKDIGLRQASGGPAQVSFNPKTHFNSDQIERFVLDGVYHPGRSARLEEVTFCGLSGKQWCVVIFGVIAAGLTIAFILANPEAAAVIALAESLGMTVATLLKVAQIAAAISALISTLCGV